MSTARVGTLPFVTPPLITPNVLQPEPNSDEAGRLVVNLEETLAAEDNTNSNVNIDLEQICYCNSKPTDEYCHPCSGSCVRFFHAKCASINEFDAKW